MNRRSFMKKVGGALAGVVGLALPSKKVESYNLDKFDPKMANIDPNSEWAQWLESSTLSTEGNGLEFNTYVQGPGFRYVWNRQLSQAEILKITREPFCFCKPPEPVLNKNHPLSKDLILCELFMRT